MYCLQLHVHACAVVCVLKVYVSGKTAEKNCLFFSSKCKTIFIFIVFISLLASKQKKKSVGKCSKEVTTSAASCAFVSPSIFFSPVSSFYDAHTHCTTITTYAKVQGSHLEVVVQYLLGTRMRSRRKRTAENHTFFASSLLHERMNERCFRTNERMKSSSCLQHPSTLFFSFLLSSPSSTRQTKKSQVALIVHYFFHISSYHFLAKFFNGSLIPLCPFCYYQQLCWNTPMDT